MPIQWPLTQLSDRATLSSRAVNRRSIVFEWARPRTASHLRSTRAKRWRLRVIVTLPSRTKTWWQSRPSSKARSSHFARRWMRRALQTITRSSSPRKKMAFSAVLAASTKAWCRRTLTSDLCRLKPEKRPKNREKRFWIRASEARKRCSTHRITSRLPQLRRNELISLGPISSQSMRKWQKWKLELSMPSLIAKFSHQVWSAKHPAQAVH